MGDEQDMLERVTKLETLVEGVSTQYRDVVKRLGSIADKLEHTAVARNDIAHIKEEQQAQWKRIDGTREDIEKINARLTHHVTHCEKVQEAKGIAEAALELARKAQGLPGKYALSIIGTALFVMSNGIGGIIVYYLTRP